MDDFRHEPLVDDEGLLVTSTGHDPLDDVDPAVLVAALAEPGCVVLRGFGSATTSFSSLVERCSTAVTLDPARRFASGGVAQKIEAGLVPQGLHVENGATPWVPDLVWFYCERAPKIGSQTTVCDGRRVWARLSETTRRRFEDQRIVFARRVPEAKWRALVLRLLDGVDDPALVTFDDLLVVTAEDVDVKYTLLPDGGIHYTYYVSAVGPGLFSDEPAFANSILTPSVNYEPPLIEFEDGTAFTAMLMREILEATDRETQEIDWCDGDVAVIDNSRMMHGRRRIRDPLRSLFNAQSYVRPDLVAPARAEAAR